MVVGGGTVLRPTTVSNPNKLVSFFTLPKLSQLRYWKSCIRCWLFQLARGLSRVLLE